MRLRTIVFQKFKNFINKLLNIFWKYNFYVNNEIGDIKSKMMSFSNIYHKHFRTKTQIKSFISNWIKMFVFVAKVNIIKNLLIDHRSTHAKILFFNLSEKKTQMKLSASFQIILEISNSKISNEYLAFITLWFSLKNSSFY